MNLALGEDEMFPLFEVRGYLEALVQAVSSMDQFLDFPSEPWKVIS